MAYVLQCDRCKKVFSEYTEGYKRVVVKYTKNGGDYSTKDISKDLCPKCINQIINLLKEK